MNRKNNEDRYAVSAYRLSDAQPTPALFAIVCDGVGGHQAGEVAAEMAVEIISQEAAASDASAPLQTMRQAIQKAGQTVLEQSEKNPELQGMGATCACVWIIDDRLYMANVGDSRIYLVRGGAIQQISTDHTWIQEAMDAGLLTPEQARGHPNAHVIRRYLGSKQPVEADTRLHLRDGESDEQAEANQGMNLLPGDQLVLCSDGLTDLVSPAEILSSLPAGLQPQKQDEAVQNLINLANQRGGHDNITIIALQIPAAEAAVSFVAPAQRGRLAKPTCLVIGLVSIVIIALLAGGAYLLLNRLSDRPAATMTGAPQASSPAILPATQVITPLQPPPVLNTPEVQPNASPSVQETAAPTYTPWPTNTTSP
ncbi:MAG: serine/threonine-protein phosphatase [Anaerolineales bacterium]|nr:serine/threonine-protein phosphatase [Anaerolineales bacterium]